MSKKSTDRMFQVIVVGGIGLVSGCSSDESTVAGATGGGGFPTEGPAMTTSVGGAGGASTTATGTGGSDLDASADAPDGFPKEGPVVADGG